MTFLEFLDQLQFPEELLSSLREFYASYEAAAIQNKKNIDEIQPTLILFLKLVQFQLIEPYEFESYHQAITEPYDLYRFGIDFLAPLIQKDKSSVIGNEFVDQMQSQIERGENVILFANHQTEPDPQAISYLLENSHPKLAKEMIFVAGHRVTTDPLAVPFSLGRNLLCIYSKNYIDHPPEQKPEKMAHNQRTMKTMRQLLSEGGKCIFVAPSGGRDRPNDQGLIEVAPFDPQGIEMFLFTAKRSHTPTHFYPLAMVTFNLLPPPDRVQKRLGEARLAQCAPIHLAFGGEIDLESLHFSENPDKKERRTQRAEAICNLVRQLYKQISYTKG